MKLVFANERLMVQGRSFPGFPLLISSGKPVEPAQTFLWEHLALSGRRRSPLTWEKYGRSLYDFMAFCEANAVDWREHPPPGLPSAIHWYRDWSAGEIGNEPSTINQRLRLVVKFYEWAHAQGYIEELPIGYEEIRSGRKDAFLQHVKTEVVSSPDVLMRENKAPPRILTGEQLAICNDALANASHQLMFEMMARTGLRQTECRTFPLAYVFNPVRRSSLVPGQKIRIWIEPKHMEIKFNKRRAIDVPYDLMENLWWYSVRERQVRANRHPSPSGTLFLTKDGTRFAASSVADWFGVLRRSTGIEVSPHVLRHTYATYTLAGLRKSGFDGDPLLYVQDRLGHANVSTTVIYLHMIDKLASLLLQQHDTELDAVFAKA